MKKKIFLLLFIFVLIISLFSCNNSKEETFKLYDFKDFMWIKNLDKSDIKSIRLEEGNIEKLYDLNQIQYSEDEYDIKYNFDILNQDFTKISPTDTSSGTYKEITYVLNDDNEYSIKIYNDKLTFNRTFDLVLKQLPKIENGYTNYKFRGESEKRNSNVYDLAGNFIGSYNFCNFEFKKIDKVSIDKKYKVNLYDDDREIYVHSNKIISVDGEFYESIDNEIKMRNYYFSILKNEESIKLIDYKLTDFNYPKLVEIEDIFEIKDKDKIVSSIYQRVLRFAFDGLTKSDMDLIEDSMKNDERFESYYSFLDFDINANDIYYNSIESNLNISNIYEIYCGMNDSLLENQLINSIDDLAFIKNSFLYEENKEIIDKYDEEYFMNKSLINLNFLKIVSLTCYAVTDINYIDNEIIVNSEILSHPLREALDINQHFNLLIEVDKIDNCNKIDIKEFYSIPYFVTIDNL